MRLLIACGAPLLNVDAEVHKIIKSRIVELTNARERAIAQVNQLSGAILELQRLIAEPQNGRPETNSPDSDSQSRAD